MVQITKGTYDVADARVEAKQARILEGMKVLGEASVERLDHGDQEHARILILIDHSLSKRRYNAALSLFSSEIRTDSKASSLFNVLRAPVEEMEGLNDVIELYFEGFATVMKSSRKNL